MIIVSKILLLCPTFCVCCVSQSAPQFAPTTRRVVSFEGFSASIRIKIIRIRVFYELYDIGAVNLNLCYNREIGKVSEFQNFLFESIVFYL